MKVAISHLQATVLVVSVLSLALLFGVISSLYDGYYTQIADAKKSRYNHYSSSTSSGSKYAADNTLDTTNSAASSSSLQQTQQQQQPVTSGSGAIQLSAKELSSGYRWVDPASGVINPTMNFKADTSKTIQLQNPTDAVHHLVIDDTNGNQLASSGDIAAGSSGQLSFNPSTAGIFEYHCIYHPTTMRGVIQVGP